MAADVSLFQFFRIGYRPHPPATAAGYRVGNLYLQLHQAMQESPVPDDLSEEEGRVYKDVLKKRTGILLRKAIRIFDMTIQLAERTRSENEHTRAAREEMARVESQVLSLYEEIPSTVVNETEETKETGGP